MGFWVNALGTLKSTFRFGPKAAAVTLDASLVTAGRTARFPDKTGTLAMLDDLSGVSAVESRYEIQPGETVVVTKGRRMETAPNFVNLGSVVNLGLIE